MLRLASPMLLALALMSPAAAFADDECDMPIRTFTIPDGTVAAQDDISTAYRRVKEYNQEMLAFQQCLSNESKAHPDASKDQLKEWAIEFNKSVDEMHQTADTYNLEYHKFKAKRAQDEKK